MSAPTSTPTGTQTSGTPAAPAVPDVPGVVGDGSSARSRATSRWRRWRFPLAVLVALAVVGVLAALPEPRTSTTPWAADNARPEGARALAQILERNGVDITQTSRFDDVVAADSSDVTVAVLGDGALGWEQQEALHDLRADLVLVAAPWAAEDLADVIPQSDTGTGSRWAACDDPDALAAETISTSGSAVAPAGATACFPTPGGEPGTGAYVVTEQDDRRITVMTSADLLTNEHLDEQGNAALAVRTFGRSAQLVWYIPSYDDPYAGDPADDDTLGTTMPPWTGALIWQLLLVVTVAAVWRGRRLGPLVTEHLPVVVRSGEATRGRGRLYRRARAHGHAAAALRAAAATRCAARLGLPRSAGAVDVIDAVSRATGRPMHDVEQLLYGPPPTDDPGLARLARDLDHLESEVHRS